jgi:xanthine dehydrogenase iron-sulfur cluster and FAD-binding subunit A
MTPEAYDILAELQAAIAQLKAVHDDPAVIPFARGRARKKVFEISDRLTIARAKPMARVVAPWTPFNQRNTFKPEGSL